MVVGLARVAHDAVAAVSVRAELVVGALADDPEAVRVVDVEQRVIVTRELREGGQVDRVAGHAVHAVDADQPRRLARLLEEPFQILGVLELESLHRGAA